ncbi:Williams-Beuren syndrome chromosomal region 16 protein-like protein, partial [Leptotrombidium deliense]
MSLNVCFRSAVLVKKECRRKLCIRRYAKTLQRGQDPEVVKKMPVFQYAGETKSKKWRVYVWGSASMGALGIANFVNPIDGKRPVENRYRPVQLNYFNLAKINDIACGYGFTVIAAAMEEDKSYKLFGCGINTDSQLGYQESVNKKVLSVVINPAPIHLPIYDAGVTVKKVACGRSHTICLTSKNDCNLGNNAYGQCGRPIIEKEVYRGSRKVHQILGISEKIAQIICGQDHTLFLTEEGNVYSCGWGADGQTGLGHFNNVGIPTRVKGDIEGEKIVSLSSTGDSVLACNEKGDVFGWGNSEYSQFVSVTREYQTNIPRHLPLKNIGKIVKVACGGTMCM